MVRLRKLAAFVFFPVPHSLLNLAGKTILNESPSVEAKLKQTCDMLNLAPHSVASQNRSHSRTLYTAAYVEAHVGTDGEYSCS